MKRGACTKILFRGTSRGSGIKWDEWNYTGFLRSGDVVMELKRVKKIKSKGCGGNVDRTADERAQGNEPRMGQGAALIADALAERSAEGLEILQRHASAPQTSNRENATCLAVGCD